MIYQQSANTKLVKIAKEEMNKKMPGNFEVPKIKDEGHPVS